MRVLRPLVLATCASALLGVLLWAAALAQADTATPVPAESPEPSAYLTLDMEAGFALDPFLVSLNGGGELDAATLDPACVGFVNDKPVMTANWTGSVDALRVFFYSDSDSTLVVQQPDGSYLCADDLDENLLDPEITLQQPMTGTYKLWGGSFDAGQLIPGLLVITARPELGLAAFDPSSLVTREPVAPLVEAPSTQAFAANAEAGKRQMAANSVITAETTVTTTLVASGTVPSFEISSDETVCGGLIGDVPDHVVQVQGDVTALRILFEAEQDTSLLVVDPEAGSACADDDPTTLNANPTLDIEAPIPGNYAIYVGRFDTETPVTGTLTITTDLTLEPAILAPAANPQD